MTSQTARLNMRRDTEVVELALPAYLLALMGEEAQKKGFELRADAIAHLGRAAALPLTRIDELSVARVAKKITDAATTLLTDLNPVDPQHGLYCAAMFVLTPVDEVRDSLTSIKGGKEGISQKFLAHPPATTIGKYCDALRWTFYHSHWHSNYGGKKWGVVNNSSIPSFLDPSEGLIEDTVLAQQFGVFGDQGRQPVFGHVGDEIIEQAALAEERMGAALGRVGLEEPIQAEAFSGGA